MSSTNHEAPPYAVFSSALLHALSQTRCLIARYCHCCWSDKLAATLHFWRLSSPSAQNTLRLWTPLRMCCFVLDRNSVCCVSVATQFRLTVYYKNNTKIKISFFWNDLYSGLLNKLYKVSILSCHRVLQIYRIGSLYPPGHPARAAVVRPTTNETFHVHATTLTRSFKKKRQPLPLKIRIS